MKTSLFFIFYFLLLFISTNVYAQTQEEKLDLPGDNLNLYSVLKLFQESETLEGFERKLNEENTGINNLDLNGDDKTDYIKVIDHVEGDVHTIVLQIDVDAKEKQDVAVFTVEKGTDNSVQVQLIGDEELYGKDYIIEPNMDDADAAASTETPNPGYSGNTAVVNGQEVTVTKTSTLIIGSWPIVRYMYVPAYTVWHSPWNWGYYPSYWQPWRPFYWHYYYGYHHQYNAWYYGHYRRWNHYRYNRWNDFYFRGFRARSAYYNQRRQEGFYRRTYSRPQSRRDGEAAFRKANPGYNNRLPGNNNRPQITKPVRPVTDPSKPVKTKPARPVTRPSLKPVTRPDVKPATRPVTPVKQKPAIQPSRPDRQRPAPGRQTKPVSRTRETKKATK